MKKKYLFLLVLVILGSLVCWGILNLNTLAERIRPTLAATLSRQLKTPVTIDKIAVRLFPTIALELSKVSLQESTTDGVQLGKIRIAPRFAELLSGTVAVKELRLENSRLNIIRDQNGVVTIAGIKLGKQSPDTSSTEAASSVTPTPDSTASEVSPQKPLSFAIATVSIVDSAVTFTDQRQEGASAVTLDHINLLLHDISPTGQLQIDGSAQFISEKPANFAVSGQADLANFDWARAQGTLTLKLNELALPLLQKQLANYAPQLAELKTDNYAQLELNIKTTAQGYQLGISLDGTAALLTWQELLNKKSGTKLSFVSTIDCARSGEGSTGIKNIKSQDTVFLLNEMSLPLELAAQLGAKSKLTIGNGQEVRLDPLREVAPPLSQYQVKGALTPLINVFYDQTPELAPEITRLEVLGTLGFKDVSFVLPGQNGRPDLPATQLNGAISLLTKGKAIIALDLRLKDAPLKINFQKRQTPEKTIIEPSRLLGFGGIINYHGEIMSTPTRPYKLSLNGSGFNIEPMLALFGKQPGISITGTLERIAADLSGEQKATPATKPEGRVELNISKGALKGLNVLAETLANAKNLPGLDDKLASLIPENYKPLLSSTDTAFDKLIVNLGLYQTNITVSELDLQHSIYSLKGSGTITGDNFDFRLQLSLAAALVQDLVAQNKSLELLQDSKKGLVIPLSVKRENGVVTVTPDTQALIDRAGRNAIKDAAVKVVDKVGGKLTDSLGGLFK